MSDWPVWLTGGWDALLVTVWLVCLPIVLVYAAIRWLLDRINK